MNQYGHFLRREHMKKGFRTISTLLALILLTTSLLTGCSNNAGTSAVTPTGVSNAEPTSAPPSTETPVPTATPTPTSTPTPAPTATPTATPIPVVKGLQELDMSLFDTENHSFMSVNPYDYETNSYISFDGKYRFRCANNNIYKCILSTGEETTVNITAPIIPTSLYDLYYNKSGELCLLLYGYGSDLKNYYVGYNFEKEKSEVMVPTDSYSFSVMQQVLMSINYNERTSTYDFFPNDDGVEFCFPSSYDINFFMVDGKYMLLQQYETDYAAIDAGAEVKYDEYGHPVNPQILTLGLYDLSDASLVAVTRTNVFGYFGCSYFPYLHDEDTIYLTISSESDQFFYSWDFLNDAPSADDLRFVYSCKIPGDPYTDVYPIEGGHSFEDIQKGPVIESLKDLDKIATQLEDKYDVEIFMSDEVIGYCSTYFCEAENDHLTTENALKLLEAGLAKYPDGFFSQLKSEATGYTKGVYFYLAGTLRGMGENTLTTAGGFKYCDGDCIKIYMDINDMSDDSTIHHELSHAIDSQLEALGLGINDNDWNKLNPSTDYHEAPYTYSYDIWGYEDYKPYIVYWDEDKSKTYFIDDYSMTYPTEDRARLMENVMRENAWLDYSEYPNLRKKLNYFAKRIRQGFDTTGWPEKTFWEKYTD